MVALSPPLKAEAGLNGRRVAELELPRLHGKLPSAPAAAQAKAGSVRV